MKSIVLLVTFSLLSSAAQAHFLGAENCKHLYLNKVSQELYQSLKTGQSVTGFFRATMNRVGAENDSLRLLSTLDLKSAGISLNTSDYRQAMAYLSSITSYGPYNNKMYYYLNERYAEMAGLLLARTNGLTLEQKMQILNSDQRLDFAFDRDLAKKVLLKK